MPVSKTRGHKLVPSPSYAKIQPLRCMACTRQRRVEDPVSGKFVQKVDRIQRFKTPVYTIWLCSSFPSLQILHSLSCSCTFTVKGLISITSHTDHGSQRQPFQSLGMLTAQKLSPGAPELSVSCCFRMDSTTQGTAKNKWIV